MAATSPPARPVAAASAARLLSPMWWTRLTWLLLAFVALLPVGALGMWSYHIAAKSVRDLVRSNNQAAATITGELLGHDLENGLHLAEAAATLPNMIQAVEAHDVEGVRQRLRPMVDAFSWVDRAFVLDTKGILWADFPPAPESLGQDFSFRDYFSRVAGRWQPSVSEVFQRRAKPSVLVVAFSVPVRNAEQQPVGILVHQSRLEQITEWVDSIRVGTGGHVILLDHNGAVAGHPRLSLQERRYEDYARLEPVQRALRGKMTPSYEYVDPISQKAMVGTFMPIDVKGRYWVVVAQQPAELAYAPIRDVKLRIATGAGFLMLLAIAAAGLLGENSRRLKRQAKRLAEQNQHMAQLAAIVESSDDAILSTTPDGLITSWSPGAGRMYGYAPEETVGKPLAMLCTDGCRKDLEPLLQWIREGRALESHPMVHQAKDGHPLNVDLTFSPIRDASGQVVQVSAVVHDITDLKNAEEELRRVQRFLESIVENLPDMVFVKDANELRFVSFNRAAEELLGYRRAQMIGKNDYDLFPRPEAEFFTAKDRAVLESRQMLDIPEEPIHTLSKGARVLHTKKIPILDEGGHPIYLLGISEDVTDRKQAEEALAEKTRELQRSNADLEQFAYVASHDLQEPLRMIASYVQLLERRYRGKLDADADEFIGYAVDGAKRMQTLINDLLSYSRVGTKGRPFEPTDCEKVLDHVLSDLKGAIEDSHAQVTHNPLPTVNADPVQIAQLLQNLVNNAIKFHGDQPPRVHISAKPPTEPPDQGQPGQPGPAAKEWLFSVRDNGIGIPPEHRDRIFLIFQRLHTRQEYPGTGIGLAVAKRIVERHGGRIWVESEPGLGSTFYFTIPEGGGL